MKKLLLPILLIAFGCTETYEFDKDFYKRKIVVESFINPDSVIKVTVAWNIHPNEVTGVYYLNGVLTHTTPVEYIDGALVQIEENGVLILSGTTVNGILQSDVYPAAGKSYRLSVKVDGEPEITAATSIPLPADASFAIREKLYESNYFGIEYSLLEYIAVDISNITLPPPPEVTAVWITGYVKYGNGVIAGFGDLYSNSPYLDQVNAVGNNSDVVQRESNVEYERGVIRIQRQALSLALPFTFSKRVFPTTSVYLDTGYETFYAEQFLLHITAPSSEYDRYRRSALKQDLIYGSLFSSDPVSVFSNIKNGTGIFAGYNTTVVATPISYIQNVNSDVRNANSDIRKANSDIRNLNSDIRNTNSDIRNINSDIRNTNSDIRKANSNTAFSTINQPLITRT